MPWFPLCKSVWTETCLPLSPCWRLTLLLYLERNNKNSACYQCTFTPSCFCCFWFVPSPQLQNTQVSRTKTSTGLNVSDLMLWHDDKVDSCSQWLRPAWPSIEIRVLKTIKKWLNLCLLIVFTFSYIDLPFPSALIGRMWKCTAWTNLEKDNFSINTSTFKKEKVHMLLLCCSALRQCGEVNGPCCNSCSLSFFSCRCFSL